MQIFVLTHVLPENCYNFSKEFLDISDKVYNNDQWFVDYYGDIEWMEKIPQIFLKRGQIYDFIIWSLICYGNE
jgi:hypothetical protein